MDRREALKRTSLYMGGALSASTVAAILQGCGPGRTPDWKPGFFTPDQALMVEDIAERILPKTDTPGAKELGVPQFIEGMVSVVQNQEDRDRFLKGMTDLDAECQEKFGNKFVDCSEEQQYEILNKHNEEVTPLQIEASKARVGVENRPFFLMIKEFTVAGFFTSEIGATQVAQYEAIPGDYKGCISVEEAGGRAWAT